MSNYGFKNVRVKDPSKYEIKVIDQKITIAQIQRATADMAKYRTAVQSAESRQNPNRSQYYNLVENCLTDGILDAILDKRFRAVTISPPSLEGTEDETLINLFKAPWMSDLLRYMMESKFWGHSLVELEMNEAAFDDPELEQLFKVSLVPRRNVHPEQGIISIMADQPYSGIPYKEEPYRDYLLEFGHDRSLGKFINLIPYILYKRNNWADFAQFNELFGMPMRVYEYDPHQVETRKQVEEQAKRAGAAAYVVIPKGTNVQHIATSTSAGSGGFKEFNQIMNQELTISVLGQTLTTGADGKGSYALGEVHQDVEEAINLEDKVWVEYQMNWVVKPMLIKTFGLNQLRGVTWKFDDTIKLSPKEKIEILTKLNDIMPIDEQYLRDEFNVPAPSAETVAAWNERRNSQISIDPTLSYEKPGKSLALAIENYGGYTAKAMQLKTVSLSMSDEIRALVESIIQEIYNGTRTVGQVPQELVNLVYNTLNQGISTGITKEVNQELIRALQQNAFRFSAAKEFNFIKDAFDALVGEDGNIKTFQVFRDEVLQLYNDYNVHWLQAEYNAAVANSQVAAQWQDIQERKENLPYLRVRVVLDDRTRHRQYNNITLPVDHPSWDYLTPPFDWNCRCLIQQIRSGEVTAEDEVPQPLRIPMAFRFNPGKEKQLFSETHPYFTRIPGEFKKDADNNFGLTLP